MEGENTEQEVGKGNLFRPLDAVKQQAKPLEPLWGVFLVKQAITSIVGDPGAGKTTFGYDMLEDLCNGRPYLDVPPEEPIKVLYMDFESSDSLITSRASYVFGESEIPNFYIYNSVDYYLTQIVQELVEFCIEKEINLLVVDNQTMAFATRDENDNSEAAKQMRLLRQICNAIGCAMILFHHTSKANLTGSRKGTGAFARARLADIMLNINLLDPDDTDYVYLEMVKNRFSTEDKMLWYLKKEEGQFIRTEPPLGSGAGAPSVHTVIYQAMVEVVSILNNGVGPDGLKFSDLRAELTKRGLSESWADHAVRRLIHQNRIFRPKYGYIAIKK